MMHVILFIFYFLLCCLAITRMRFFRGEIKMAWLIFFFSLHVVAGCIHTWVAYQFYPRHGDIWRFYNLSLGLKQMLLTNPTAFVNSFFSNKSQFNITDTSHPMLGVQYDILIYMNAFFNIASFNNLYINTLFFSFPVFVGTIALFKVFYTLLKNPLPALCTILLPSSLFWTSVIYKDGLFYMAIGFFYYFFFQTGKSAARKIILLFLCASVMILSRTNALVTLLPAFFFLLLTEKKTFSRNWAASILCIVTLIITILFNTIIHGGILSAISARQNDFDSLAGGSRIYMPSLQPTAISFLAALPRAVLNGFLQPLPGTGGKFIYTAFSAELILIWIIILYACVLMMKRKEVRLTNFDIACLLFTLPGLVIIGYIVPFAGAIVRYRSIYLPFLLAPFINILCSYPVAFVQAINHWLEKHVMIAETKIAR